MGNSLHANPNEISTLPVLVLMPHNRCDCHCLMCDIWKQSKTREISEEQLQRHMTSLKKLQVRWVVLSGGEPLLHSDLFSLTHLLRKEGIRVTLLSTGQRLAELAAKIALQTDDAILSLDGPEQVHDKIRRVEGAFQNLARGIRAVREHRLSYPFSCRTTVQRQNFRLLRQTLWAAHSAGFDSISFLAADLTSAAFNRPGGWSETRRHEVGIPIDEIAGLEDEIECLIQEHAPDIRSGYIRESPEKLRRIAHHFRAHWGEIQPIAPRCNAPWVSAVVEADGTVRPCFFHKALGNLQTQSLVEVINSDEAQRFRRGLNVATNAICQRCVCSLHFEGTQSEVNGSDPQFNSNGETVV
jgi:MoaA/NifB/PqqE/SkfB family radical SAM enzyme